MTERAAGRGRALLVLGVVVVLVRLAVLLAPGPDLSEEGRVMAEEYARGVAVHEWLRGPLLDWQDYQQPFWGGHVLATWIAAPFCALLGETLFAMRLAVLPFALALALSGFALVDRVAGRRAAWLAGLLLAVPAPGFLLLSCTLQGTHCEALGLAFLSILLLVRAFEAPSLARCALLGLLLGLDLWFGYPALLPALFTGVLLVWTLRPAAAAGFAWRKAAPLAAAFVLAALVGAWPWLRLAGAEQSSTQVYGQPASHWFDLPRLLQALGGKLELLATQDLALSLWLPGSNHLGIGLLAHLLAWTLLGLWASAAWSRRDALLALLLPSRLRAAPDEALPRVLCAALLCLPLFHVALLLGSTFDLGPRDWIQNMRYLLPLWPLVSIGVALAVARLAPPRDLLVGGLLVLASCAGTAGRLSPDAWGRDLSVPVASARHHGRMSALWRRGDREALARAVSRVQRRDPAERDEYLHSLGLWFRYWSAPTSKLGKLDEARREESRATLAWLGSQVPEAQRRFFAPPAADEVVRLSERVQDRP